MTPELDDETFIVRFEAYEGPIEALLDLARAQRVDLSVIDILGLVGQFEAVVGRAMSLRLELAADWLVMASWLAFLKSKELLRRPKEDKSTEPDADALAFHLRRLNAVKTATESLSSRKQIGRDWFAPAADEEASLPSRLGISLHALLSAYHKVATERVRTDENGNPVVPLKPFDLSSVDSALRGIEQTTRGIDWVNVLSLVPKAEGLRLRSNIATHLIAALELARDGRLEVRQDTSTEPVMVRDAHAAV